MSTKTDTLKRALAALEQANTPKQDDGEETLKKLSAVLDSMVEEKTKKTSALEQDRNAIVGKVAESVKDMIGPLVDSMANQASMNKEAMKEALREISIELPKIEMPELKMPEIRIPKPSYQFTVPDIHIPQIKIPKFDIPPAVVPDNLTVGLKGINLKTPLPVVVTNPVGGGPRSAISIKDILTDRNDSIMDEPNKAMRVNVVAGSTAGTQYNDTATPDQSGGVLTLAGAYDGTGSVFSLRNGSGVSDKALRVTQAVDVGNSVYVNGWNNGAAVDVGAGVSGTQTLRVVQANDVTVSVNVVSGSTAGTQYNDSATPDQAGGVLTLAGAYDGTGSVFSLRNGPGISDKALRVVQAVDAVTSVVVNNIVGPIAQGDSASALRVVQAGDAQVSIVVNGFNNGAAVDVGSGPSGTQTLRVTMATDANSSVNLIGQDENSGPVSASTLRVVQAVDVGVSTQVNSWGSSIDTNVGPSGANTLRVTVATDSNASVFVTGASGTIMAIGDLVSGSTDDGVAPIKTGGLAASTNHTKVTDGQRVSAVYDLRGRQISVPQQPRELVSQSLTLLATGAETSILTQVASTFLDLVSITCVNQSAGIWPVKFNESSGGANVYTLQVPANDTRGVVFQVPFTQTSSGRDWTATLVGSDISNPNLTVIVQAVQNN